jgi:hypothetical protein
MAVTVTCSTNNLAVDLAVGSEQLRYTVEFEGDLTFTLRSERPHTLLDDDSPFPVRIWPEDDSENPQSDHVIHVLGVTFGEGGSVHFLVEKLSDDGEAVVKDCHYTSDRPGDKFLDALNIIVV